MHSVTQTSYYYNTRTFQIETIVMSIVIGDAKKVNKANNRATNSGHYAYKLYLEKEVLVVCYKLLTSQQMKMWLLKL